MLYGGAKYYSNILPLATSVHATTHFIMIQKFHLFFIN